MVVYIMGLIFYHSVLTATVAVSLGENQKVCGDRTLEIQNSLPNYFTEARGDINPSVYHAATSVFQHIHKSAGISVRLMLEATAKMYSKQHVSK